VEVRMMVQGLPPGVQNAQDAKLCAEMFGVTCNVQEGLGDGSKQAIIK
jgi:hypothetical protein